MSRGSPGRKRPENCELSPMSRQRASRLRPSASWRRSQAPSAAGTSPPATVSSWARAQPSAAALAVPGRRVRTDGERGVAQQAGAAERHPGHLDVVHHLDERLVGTGDGLGDRRSEKVRGRPPHARDGRAGRRARGHRHRTADAVPAGHEGVERRSFGDVDVPDGVDQAVAFTQRAVQRRYRVDEDVATGQHLVGERVAEPCARAGGQVTLGHGPAPGHVPRIRPGGGQAPAVPGRVSQPRPRRPGGRPRPRPRRRASP